VYHEIIKNPSIPVYSSIFPFFSSNRQPERDCDQHKLHCTLCTLDKVTQFNRDLCKASWLLRLRLEKIGREQQFCGQCDRQELYIDGRHGEMDDLLF
jgi:hypothetical protein